MQIDPVEQFEIQEVSCRGHRRRPSFRLHQLGALHAHHRQSGVGADARRDGPAIVPGRMQSVAEMSYEFVADTIRSTTGDEGMRFFPFVFSLFMFVWSPT